MILKLTRKNSKLKKDILHSYSIKEFTVIVVINFHSPGEGKTVRDVQRREQPHTQGGEREHGEIIGRRPRQFRSRGSSFSHSRHQDVVPLPVSSLLSFSLLLFYSPLPSLPVFVGHSSSCVCSQRQKSL